MPSRPTRPTPRMLHPVAWWVWAIGLATAAAHTTNPVLLLLVVAVAAYVVLERREIGAANAFVPFLVLGLVAIGLRVVLSIVLGNGVSGRVVLLELPQASLPPWLAGIRLGGAVTLEGLVAALVDGLRLAATLACLGAANALASPRRLVRYAPATLYDIGTAVVVALTYAPQLGQLAGRVRAARRLRGHDGRGLRDVAALVVPVLEGSLDRSLGLAASMEARGYGRTPVRSGSARQVGSLLALAGGAGTLAGLFGVLSPSVGGWLGLPMLVGGLALATASLVVGARRDARTAYRRDPWAWPEWLVGVLGCVAGAALVIGQARGWPGVTPAQVPLGWPGMPLIPTLGIGCAALAGLLTPVPPRLAAARERARVAAGSQAVPA